MLDILLGMSARGDVLLDRMPGVLPQATMTVGRWPTIVMPWHNDTSKVRTIGQRPSSP